MPDWPETSELKALLDVTSEDWDDHLDGLLAAGIDRVKLDVGSWDDYVDEPDDALAKAALRAAVLLRPNASDPAALDKDPDYQGLLKGHRRRFGIA